MVRLPRLKRRDKRGKCEELKDKNVLRGARPKAANYPCVQIDLPVPEPDCRTSGTGPPDKPDIVKARVALSQDAIISQKPNDDPKRRKMWEDKMRTDFQALKMSLIFVEDTACRLTADIARTGGQDDWGPAKRDALEMLLQARKFLWREAKHQNANLPSRIPWYVKAMGSMSGTVKALLRF